MSDCSFLSSGGTCRDPMAKAIMKQLLAMRRPGYHLRVEAMALNSPSLDQASGAARRAIQRAFGSDLLAEHRPTMITPELAEDADLVLVMDHHLLAKTLPLGPLRDDRRDASAVAAGPVAGRWLVQQRADAASQHSDPFLGRSSSATPLFQVPLGSWIGTFRGLL